MKFDPFTLICKSTNVQEFESKNLHDCIGSAAFGTDYYTLLHVAALVCNVDIARHILHLANKASVEYRLSVVNKENQYGITPLFCAAALSWCTGDEIFEMCNLLLYHGANPNCCMLRQTIDNPYFEHYSINARWNLDTLCDYEYAYVTKHHATLKEIIDTRILQINQQECYHVKKEHLLDIHNLLRTHLVVQTYEEYDSLIEVQKEIIKSKQQAIASIIFCNVNMDNIKRIAFFLSNINENVHVYKIALLNNF